MSLVKHNPKRLFIAAGNGRSARAVINDIKGLAPEVEVVLVEYSLASFESIVKAAGKIGSNTDRLDLLYGNAGIMGAPPGLTVDGYEAHFGDHHLGHTLFIQMLFPKPLESTVIQPDVRINSTTSDGYRFHAPEDVTFKDLRTTQLNLPFLSSLGGRDS